MHGGGVYTIDICQLLLLAKQYYYTFSSIYLVHFCCNHKHEVAIQNQETRTLYGGLLIITQNQTEERVKLMANWQPLISTKYMIN